MNKLINLGLVLGFQICYLEWGKGSSSFIWQAEYQFFTQPNFWQSFTHPIILGALLGQIILLVSVFQKKPHRLANLIGVLALSAIVAVFLLAGFLSFNYKMILSVVPFIVCVVLFFLQRRKEKPSLV